MDSEELISRFAYHPPSSPKVIDAHQTVRLRCASLAALLDELLPDCREKVLCMERLDETAMYANAAIARTQLTGGDTS